MIEAHSSRLRVLTLYFVFWLDDTVLCRRYSAAGGRLAWNLKAAKMFMAKRLEYYALERNFLYPGLKRPKRRVSWAVRGAFFGPRTHNTCR